MNFITSILYTTGESTGGLFDFNATLSIIAIQFIELTLALTFIFYRPVGIALNSRRKKIKEVLAFAWYNQFMIEKLNIEYAHQVKTVSINTQSLLNKYSKRIESGIALEMDKFFSIEANKVEKVNRRLKFEAVVYKNTYDFEKYNWISTQIKKGYFRCFKEGFPTFKDPNVKFSLPGTKTSLQDINQELWNGCEMEYVTQSLMDKIFMEGYEFKVPDDIYPKKRKEFEMLLPPDYEDNWV